MGNRRNDKIALISIAIMCAWLTPVQAESNRFQSAYHAEFGKKLIAEGKLPLAAEEFLQALYFDVNNAAVRAAPAVQLDAEVCAVAVKRIHLLAGLVGNIRIISIRIGWQGGGGMVDGGKAPVGAPHFQATLLEL